MTAASRLLAIASAIGLAACAGDSRPASDSADRAVQTSASEATATPAGHDTTRMAPSADVPSSLPAGYVIDSAIPIPEAIRRFQATVPRAPTAFAGGASSPDDLFRRYMRALGSRDTAALRRLALSRAEFAYLYDPESKYTKEPNQLQPEFLWHFINENGEAGVGRALARYGAPGWTYLRHSCGRDSEAPRGAIVTLGPCTLSLRSPDGVEVRAPLVNEVVSRGGRFKLTGFANEL